MRKRFFVFLIALSLAGLAVASEEDKGTAGANFLKIAPSARAASLGGAYCALADDPEAPYFNPAGLPQIKERAFGFSYTKWAEDVKSGFIGLAFPTFWKMDGVLGLSLHYMGIGGIEGRDKNGGRDGDFSCEGIAVGISYGEPVRAFDKDFLLGGSLKLIYERLDNESGSSPALDLGLLFKATPDLTLGASLKNLGPKKLRVGGEASSLPATMTTGLAYNIRNTTFVFDLNIPNDEEISFSAGAEYWHKKKYAIRAGYKSQEDELNSSNLTFGLGYRARRFGKIGHLDYAYSSLGDLGDVHRVSYIAQF
ncbi:PorV/PorQ family protein [bacterium]|nr:PorV/PorQ family protein [bacterium]